jgi:osmotically-inducible protein OsmY
MPSWLEARVLVKLGRCSIRRGGDLNEWRKHVERIIHARPGARARGAQSQAASDQRIQAAVVRKLQDEKLRRGNSPQVTVQDGVVTLTGQVRSLWEKEATIELVRKTNGVTRTVSDMTIAQAENDRAIADELSKGVLGYPRYSIFDDISGRVKNGAVTLDGMVTDSSKASDVREMAARIRGVQAVQNNLKTYAVSQSDDRLRVELSRRIFQNPGLQTYATGVNPSIHIIVDHAAVTVKGFVNSAMDKQQVETIVRLTPGILKVSNELQVSP